MSHNIKHNPAENHLKYNPFERGYDNFYTERLAMIYTQDLPCKLHYIPIHPIQEAHQDHLFQNKDVVYSSHHALIDTPALADELRCQHPHQGHLIKIIYRIWANASPKASKSINSVSRTCIGQTSTLEQAHRIIQNLQFETGFYSRCWEISSQHLQQKDKSILLQQAQLLPQVVSGPYLIDPFILDDPHEENAISLGLRLHRTPWTDPHLALACHYSLDELHDSYKAEGLSDALISLVLAAGQADVRILIFNENSKILHGLPVYPGQGT